MLAFLRATDATAKLATADFGYGATSMQSRVNDLSSKRFQFFDQQPETADFLAEVIAGLSSEPAAIPPKYFYDEAGSRWFEKICSTGEYYPTRTEAGIIRDNIDDIADTLGRQCLLIEPGSGDSYKVRLLLDALRPVAYLPIDISRRYLQDEAQRLASEFDWLDVHAICADFTRNVSLPYEVTSNHRVIFFPGSTIGNFLPSQVGTVLSTFRKLLDGQGGLLIGVDLHKDAAVLNAAYNDRAGFTRAFNLNLLHRINRELGADFDPGQFTHLAFYNPSARRVEMHLESRRRQAVNIGGHVFHFGAGQRILTEYSHKYTIGDFQALAARAGFAPVKTWTDSEALFSLHYLRCGKAVTAP